MKNFEQLANQIVAAINENGVGAITGDVLQGILLAMKDKMQLSCFEGVATTSTTPVTDYYGEHFYIAYSAGTYSNFDSTVLDGSTVVMFYKLAGTNSWSHVVLNVDKTVIDKNVTQGSTNAVASGAVYGELKRKVDTIDFTPIETKVNGIEAGAEVNVQSDWDEADSSSDAYIRNKPDLDVYATKTAMATALAGKADDDIIPVICDAFAQMQHQIDALTKAVADNIDRHNVYAHNVDADSMSINGMPMVLTASTAGAPGTSVIPDNWDADTMGQWLGVTQFVGQIYVDTVSGKVYFATKVTNSTADWVVLN